MEHKQSLLTLTKRLLKIAATLKKILCYFYNCQYNWKYFSNGANGIWSCFYFECCRKVKICQ